MMLLLVVTLLFAIATGEGVLYRVSCFLTLVIACSYVYLRLRLRRLDVWMENKSHVLHVGDVLKAHVHLRNNSRLETGWVEIVLMSNMPGSVSGVVTAISARAREQLEMPTFCYARGLYTIGPVLARTSDRLGLFRTEIIRGSRVTVVVQPPIMQLPYFHLPAGDRSEEEGTWYRSQTRTPQVATVREYIHGDSLHQIHWLSTAKSGQLMSKEFDSGGGGDAWIVLDLERRTHQNQWAERTDEYAAAIAASLANHVLRGEHSVGLIACGDHEYLVPLGSGTGQMSSILEALTLSKTEGDSSLATVLTRNRGRFGRSDSLLVVTASTATEWIPILRELKYRGLNTVVILVDPASFGGRQPLDEVVMQLVTAGIPAYLVHRGDSLALALSRRITLPELPILEQYTVPEPIRAFETRWEVICRQK